MIAIPDVAAVSPMGSYDLTLCWDHDRLLSDLAAIEHQKWTPHYNEVYRGDWSGLALRSVPGSALQLAGHEVTAAAFADTGLLDRTPYFRQLLSFFECRLKSVRLLKLEPKSAVREHCDPALGRDSGEVRIHIPVRTNPEVEFYLDGDRLLLEVAQTYTLDVSRPHRVKNDGETARIHLVIDAELNPWLREALGRARSIKRIDPPPQSFPAFRKVVLSSPDLQRELRGNSQRDAFAELLVKTAHDRGFEFDRDDIEWRSVPSLDPLAVKPVKDWAPVSVRYSESVPFVDWISVGPRGFAEPFYQETIAAARREPFAQAFQWKQRLELLETGRNPTGFIFHMSRCGSTLLGRMLAALDRATVISEAPPIDDVMEASSRVSGLDPAQQIAWLRSLIWSLPRRSSEADLFFVKLDAWHIHKLPLIRMAFPEVPWIFLYRDPDEVLNSQARHPARFALPGGMDPSILGLSFPDVIGLTREEWCARVLAGFCRSALRFADNRGCFLNYRHLPHSLWKEVAAHFSISFNSAEIEIMQAVAVFDAKSPGRRFQPDSDLKQGDTIPAVKQVAHLALDSLYRELETHPQGLR